MSHSPNDGSYKIKLVKDVTLRNSDLLRIRHDTTLDLNGHVLNIKSQDASLEGFIIYKKTSFTIIDSDPHTEHFGHLKSGRWIWDENAATGYQIDGGVICGGRGVHVSIPGYETETQLKGGAIYSYGTLHMTGGTLAGNHADLGGAIALKDNSSTRLENVSLLYNTASNGGAIHQDYNTQKLELISCTAEHNSADNLGGVLYSLKTVEVTGGSYSYNTAGAGGAFYFVAVDSNDYVNVSDTVISHNQAVLEDGGAFYVGTYEAIIGHSRDVTFNNTTFEENTAYLRGGAIYHVDLIMKMKNCTFLSNSTQYADGGAVYVDKRDVAVIDACTFQKNTSKMAGGAIFLAKGSNIIKGNCLFEENSAVDSGGAIFDCAGKSYFNITARDNKAKFGGAVALHRTGSVFDSCYITNNHSSTAVNGSGIFVTPNNSASFKGLCVVKDNISDHQERSDIVSFVKLLNFEGLDPQSELWVRLRQEYKDHSVYRLESTQSGANYLAIHSDVNGWLSAVQDGYICLVQGSESWLDVLPGDGTVSDSDLTVQIRANHANHFVYKVSRDGEVVQDWTTVYNASGTDASADVLLKSDSGITHEYIISAGMANMSGLYHDYHYTVKASTVPVEKNVRLDPTSMTVNKDDSFEIKVTVSPEDPSIDKNSLFQFDHAHFELVNINDPKTIGGETTVTGVFKGVAVGTDRISSTYDGKTVYSTIQVEEKGIDPITVSPGFTTYRMSMQTTAPLIYAANTQATGKLTWTSSNPSVAEIAEVDQNQKTARILMKKSGQTQISVQTEQGALARATLWVTNDTLVKSIQVEPDSLDLVVNDTFRLSVTVLPQNAQDRSVTWSSSNEAVATVSNDGTVTAISPGTDVVITASSSNGLTDSCIVNVTADVIEAESVEVIPHELHMEKDTSYMLKTKFIPENATDTQVVWSSDHEEIVTVNEKTGELYAVAEGDATITVSLQNGKGSDTCLVHTVDDGKVRGIWVLPSSLDLAEADSYELSATVFPYTALDQRVLWYSSDESVATVDASGRVTAVNGGDTSRTCNITAMTYATDEYGNHYSDSCEVQVWGKGQPIEPVSVSLVPSELFIASGANYWIEAVYNDPDARDVGISWVSSNPEIVNVDQYGKIQTLRPGDAIITVTLKNGSTATCLVHVMENYPDPGRSVALAVGDQMVMRDIIRMLNIAEERISSEDTITCMDDGFVSVTGSGFEMVVTGLHPGRNEFTVRMDGGIFTFYVDVYEKEHSYVPVEEHQDAVHVHEFTWDTTTGNATTDGEMSYRCQACGAVKYRVPISAYYYFNIETADQIRNASSNATVTVDAHSFISFHDMVRDALNARPDVTLVVDYQYEQQKYEMTVAPGESRSSDLDKLWAGTRFCGFRNMGTRYDTIPQS